VQPGDPGHPFGQPGPDQLPAGGVLHLDIVMIFGPVVTDEPHELDLPPAARNTVGSPRELTAA
jgi:hypothetical protein